MSDDADTQREQIEMLQAMRGQSAELGAAADAAQARLDEAAAAAPAPAAAAPHHHLGGGGGRHQLESGGLSQGGGGPAASAPALAAAAASAAAAAAPAPLGARARKAEVLNVAMGRGGSAAAAEELDKSHKFWSTQPVPRMAAPSAGAPAQLHGPLEPLKSPEEVKDAPLPLPKSFEWCTLDVADPAQLSELYTVRRRARSRRQAGRQAGPRRLTVVSPPTPTPHHPPSLPRRASCCATTTWRTTTPCFALPTRSPSCSGA